MSDKDDLKEALEAFDEVSEAERENRKDALNDLRFARLGEQWSDELKEQRDSEARPCLTINKLPTYIRHVVNNGRQNRSSLLVHPVDSTADHDTADILQGLIYSIEQQSSADIAWDTALDFAVSMGWGYARIDVDYACDDSFDLDLMIKAVRNPFSIYGDPYAMDSDSANWNSAFVREVMQKKEYKRRWPDADVKSFEDTQDVMPEWMSDEGIVVAEFWTRSREKETILRLSDDTVVKEDVYLGNRDTFEQLGLIVTGERQITSHKVLQKIISGVEILETNKWAGKYIPIIPVYGEEVNVEGKRYLRSLVRDPKDVQMMFNYWRTASTELVALAPKNPFIGPKGAFNTDADKWVTANSRSHAYIEYDGQTPPERQPFAGPPAGALQEAMNAEEDMKAVIGIYDAGLGAPSNETSGIAVEKRLRNAETSTFHYIDNQNRSIRHSGRILLDLIPHTYTGKRVIRALVGSDRKEVKMVPLNTPVQLPAGIQKIYDLSVGKYDVVMSPGPSYLTQRERSATQMIKILEIYPDAVPVIGDLLAKNLDWVGADEIADRIKSMQGESPEMLALKQQFEIFKQQTAEKETMGVQLIQTLQQQIVKLQQDKALETRKLDIAGYEAETKRLTATSKDLSPDALKFTLLKTIAEAMTSDRVSEPAELPGG